VVAVLPEDNDAAHLIEEADCGVVIAPGDAGGLALAVERLAADPAERRRLGANGRRHAEENVALDVVVRRWESLLDQVAGHRPLRVAG
jgi:colanic acid biosynthesis glycosyl transferase WcaI